MLCSVPACNNVHLMPPSFCNAKPQEHCQSATGRTKASILIPADRHFRAWKHTGPTKKTGSCPTMAQRWRMWHELGVADHRFTGEGVICNEAAGQFSKALSATNPRLFLHICSIFGQGQGHLLLASAQTWLYMVPCNNYRVYGLWMVIVTRDSCAWVNIYTYIIIWYITFSWGYYGILPLFITILIINESLLIAIITTKSLLLRDGHLSIHRILWYID